MKSNLTIQIINKDIELGATMAEIADIDMLNKSSLHKIINLKTGLETENFKGIKWPHDTKSALITAYSHPADKPELGR